MDAQNDGGNVGFCSKCGIVREENPTELGSCPCLLVSYWGHTEECSLVRAAACPIEIDCEHSCSSVCEICTPCTCGAIERRAAQKAS